jgi:aspartate carbamoyltransferase catalytic subunit
MSLVDEQVRNGVPIRMALLYLLAAALPEEAAFREPGLREA